MIENNKFDFTKISDDCIKCGKCKSVCPFDLSPIETFSFKFIWKNILRENFLLNSDKWMDFYSGRFCPVGVLSEWGFVQVGFCPMGFCPSGVLSEWGFVLDPVLYVTGSLSS